ncbi:Ubiquitin-conjugating enzyme E2 T [Nymphon striatum]|nr:Ubiquitin-conjugating enzyme E2 T [Nymphon striatum]
MDVKLNRIKKEMEILEIRPPPGISCWVSEDSFDKFEASIIGSKATPYENGIFKLEIVLPNNYPFEPPKVRFLTSIYHPNIDSGGRICLDALKMPPQGNWKPSLNISSILLSIQLLMSEPNPEDPLMAEIAHEFKYNSKQFAETAKLWTLKYASENSVTNVTVDVNCSSDQKASSYSSPPKPDNRSSDPSNNNVPASRSCILHIAASPEKQIWSHLILPTTMFLHPGIEFSIFPSSPQQRSYVVSFLSFDEKNWSTVQATAEKKCAKHQFLKSVYYDLVVSLPQNPNENDGYHVACYQKFTAITSTTSAPGDRKYDLSERILPYLRSNSRADDKTEPSSSGIFPVTCLFCNSKKKKKKGGAIERIKMQSPIGKKLAFCTMQKSLMIPYEWLMTAESEERLFRQTSLILRKQLLKTDQKI